MRPRVRLDEVPVGGKCHSTDFHPRFYTVEWKSGDYPFDVEVWDHDGHRRVLDGSTEVYYSEEED